MSKSSKSCNYCGHLLIMNKVNNTKKTYTANQNKLNISQIKPELDHKNETFKCNCSECDCLKKK